MHESTSLTAEKHNKNALNIFKSIGKKKKKERQVGDKSALMKSASSSLGVENLGFRVPG